MKERRAKTERYIHEEEREREGKGKGEWVYEHFPSPDKIERVGGHGGIGRGGFWFAFCDPLSSSP